MSEMERSTATIAATAMPLDPARELEILLASRFALIAVESREETRLLRLMEDAGGRAGRGRGWGLFQWTITEGLERVDVDKGGPQRGLTDPAQLLRHLKSTPMPGIYVLLDFHPYLGDPVNVRLLKDIAQDYGRVPRTVVLLSHEIRVPTELEHLTACLRLGLPSVLERQAVVRRVASEWTTANGGRAVQIDPVAQQRLVENLSGLHTPDMERLARQAIFNDGALTMNDLPGVLASKYQLLNRGGVLSYEPETARFAEVGGLLRLRQWLQSRKSAFDGRQPQLDPPRGLMLLGVQGCGKSLAVRMIAGLFGVPLLRLDFGALYSKWQGEAERNLRESLSAAQGLAPCVLWIDEMEKALAADAHDGGASRRLLGSFLTWLAEHRERVMVVATANDITSLPPELVRKGRFDEIFFIDLPNAAARAEILGIHTRKRGISLQPVELQALAARSEGFSGAELEQAVVAAQYTGHSINHPVSAALIAREMQLTQPLSVVMGEHIEALREWARERTVPADA